MYKRKHRNRYLNNNIMLKKENHASFFFFLPQKSEQYQSISAIEYKGIEGVIRKKKIVYPRR